MTTSTRWKLSPALVLIVLTIPFGAGAQALPKDVQKFVDSRNSCDHFRSEPFEAGSEPKIKERRDLVVQSTLKFCTGIDAHLAALRRTYRGNAAVSARLQSYDGRIEP